MNWRVITGDCLVEMAKFAPASFHCCVTSPPYWGLRDYGVDAQLGLERVHDCLGWATGKPCGECYVCHLVAVFREVKRVLRDDGVLFLNLGDSYNSIGHKKSNSGYGSTGLAGGIAQEHSPCHRENSAPGLKHKDLVGIPWRVALALQADGWWLRSDVIWAKPNPMPESVTDRPTRSHEYVFMLTKSARYYFDSEAVKEAATCTKMRGTHGYSQVPDGGDNSGLAHRPNTAGRNLRSVWTIVTRACKEAHFATFPPELPEKCIKAATSERGVCPKCGKQWERVIEHTDEVDPSAKGSRFDVGKTGERDGGDRTQAGERFLSRTTGWRPGCECGLEAVPAQVLDVFGGAGTVGMVAAKLGRSATMIELNPEYCAIARKRIEAATRQGKLFAHA